MTRKTAPKGHKVKVAGKVHDGLGGYLPVGHLLDAPEETIQSLKAKGLVE